MKSSILTILFLIFSYLCHGQLQDTVPLQNEGIELQFDELKQNLIDSITRFEDLTEVTKIDDNSQYSFYIGTVNNKRIALISMTYKSIYLFYEFNNKWIETDSMIFADMATSFISADLNRIPNKDFIVRGEPNCHGQAYDYVLLSDTNGYLHFRSDVSLHNISYDYESKIIRSFYFGSTNFTKEIYRWENDSLVLIRGVELVLVDYKVGYMLTYYNEKDGKRDDYKVIWKNAEKIFHSELWKDN